jgi:Tol biopolymer transport system component
MNFNRDGVSLLVAIVEGAKMNRSAFKAWCLAVILGSTGWAQVTQLVSVASSGAHANSYSNYSSISADGRFVAFASPASNLVPGDTNGTWDVFVHDRQLGTTERVSVATGGAEGNGDSLVPSISADGRFVAFESQASNLVAGDTNGAPDIFVRDRQSGTTERVSVATGGAEGSDGSYNPSISPDGRFVAFESDASNLVPGDTNNLPDVFVRDRQSGTTERVSVTTSGAEVNGPSLSASISAEGRFVAFESFASNLVAGDTNGAWDIFVHDRQSGTTERVSVGTGGTQGNGDSYYPTISADGHFLAFTSEASNLVAGDTNVSFDEFVHDRQTGTTERVSVATGGAQGNGNSGGYYPASVSISADGRFVAFASDASNLVAGDTNGLGDILVRDRQRGTTERVSVGSGEAQANWFSNLPSISADGRYVSFSSGATNLVPGGSRQGCFVHDRHATGETSLCDPGVGGVVACPCSNPPNGPGHGCDNSSATGGAILSASGIAYLSMDSLVFTTSAEKPTATSIVMQGNALAAGGLVFGQGVRCVGGTLKRLYTKTAVGGSITAPSGADPTVSARSATLGDVIQAGQSRWYLVYYRDPIVLGGCPAASTFNATQTGQVVWSL